MFFLPFWRFFFWFCIFYFFLGGVGQIEPWSRDSQGLISRPKINKKTTSKNRKSRLQNHLQNAIEQTPYKKNTTSLQNSFRPPTSLQNSIDPKKKSPTKWLPQGSASSKRNCYKMTIFCWNSTRSYNWIFTANWLAHGHRSLQKHLYKQHCSEHKGPLSVGDISTHICSEPICRWTAYDCLIALERRHLTHFAWQRVFGKTRVFRKTRVFTANPGFAGQTSVFVVNPGNFQGLEAQGIYIYIYLLLTNQKNYSNIAKHTWYTLMSLLNRSTLSMIFSAGILLVLTEKTASASWDVRCQWICLKWNCCQWSRLAKIFGGCNFQDRISIIYGDISGINVGMDSLGRNIKKIPKNVDMTNLKLISSWWFWWGLLFWMTLWLPPQIFDDFRIFSTRVFFDCFLGRCFDVFFFQDTKTEQKAKQQKVSTSRGFTDSTDSDDRIRWGEEQGWCGTEVRHVGNATFPIYSEIYWIYSDFKGLFLFEGVWLNW